MLQIRSEIRSVVANVRQEQVVSHLVAQGELGRLAIGDEADLRNEALRSRLIDHDDKEQQEDRRVQHKDEQRL